MQKVQTQKEPPRMNDAEIIVVQLRRCRSNNEETNSQQKVAEKLFLTILTNNKPHNSCY